VSEGWNITAGERDWSISNFLADYDRIRKNRKSFDKTHVRQTYLIRTDLKHKVDDLCKNRPGFKTKFINFAIEKCLWELETAKHPADIDKVTGKVVARELSREEVEELIANALKNRELDESTKNTIRERVMTDLFKEESQTSTTLFNKDLRGNQYQSPTEKGRGLKRFKTPEKCVQSLIEYWVKMSLGVK
jgi:hypothetical protein